MLSTINQWDDRDQALNTNDLRMRPCKSVDVLDQDNKKEKTEKKKLPADSWHSLSGLATSVENINTKTHNGASNGQAKPEGNLSVPVPENNNSIIKDIVKEIRKSTDITMLKNPVFVIYAFSCILCMAGK